MMTTQRMKPKPKARTRKPTEATSASRFVTSTAQPSTLRSRRGQSHRCPRRRTRSGPYSKIELYAESVDGVVDGESVDVKIPSEKLQLTKPFEVVAGESVDFVFDINVVKRATAATTSCRSSRRAGSLAGR